MALEVHHLDRYPVVLPTDLRAFLVHHSAVKAWVAEQDGVVVGHVALHRSSQPGVVDLACQALDCDSEQLGILARLIVSPSARRLGIAQGLIEVVTEEINARGLYPVLDVVTAQVPAIALYERLGWTNAGVVATDFADGMCIEEFVYLGPGATPS